MKIKVADVTTTPRSYSDTLDLKALNDRMNEGNDNEVIFLKEPEVELSIHGTPQAMEASCTIKTRYRQPCSRCLKELEMDLVREVEFVIKPESSILAGVEPDEDVNVVYYDGPHIDLEDALQETLILAISPFLLPERDENGYCSICNERYNDAIEDEPKNNLGDLLRQAAKKREN